MASLDKIKEDIKEDLLRLNDLIRSRLVNDNPLMSDVIETFLKQKGKQIRPIIVMLCAGMQGEVNDHVIEAAASVELLHNASLVHDDVIDESTLRRNRPTVNAVWDNHIAVLIGDYFVSTALQLAIATGDLRIINEIGQLGRLLSIGELDQIYNARCHSLTEESYFRIIELKTASLFVACAKVGCYASGASDELTGKLAEIARLLGLCFQIRDDIFDYFPSDGNIGKPTGNDLREGKITLPLIYALADKSLADSADMNRLVAKDELSVAEIDVLYRYAIEGGGVDYAYAVMDKLRAKAAEVASTFERPTPLMTLFDYIIERKF